ncbi:hypothetical protein E1A91_D02G126300v1 [Gossypium mustelinum]|uniref:mannan endo-1,4-beta-mannosidase n=1 Tax=Gossypium mustelinum TaxID=34275 RepID=A0A5D2VUW9_GOSMU|nr:hypothetical protein E1A91_D02G126300v1 [Gossypium mustelinum]
MDTCKRCFLLSLAFLMVFFENLGTNVVFGFNGNYKHHSPHFSTSQGIYDMEDVEDDGWQMVETKGNQFIVNSQPFYVNGFNTYWLMVMAADQSTRGKVSEVFQQASAVGLTVCWTWAFNDGRWRALQKSPSVYDEEVFKALDFVVSEAKKYKIRLMLSLVNNWDAYGGKPQYVKWGKAAGLNLTSDDEFFSHPTLRSYYKAHVKGVVNRVNTFTNITYKDDPTIFAWELMNEPRCTSDPSGDTLQSWIAEMAVYVKSLDAKHIWISQTISDAHLQFTTTWMEAHIEDAEKYLGMPVIFAEFGVSSKDPGYNSSFRDALISTVYKTVLNSTKKGGSGAGSLLWQLFPEGMDNMDDGYAIVLAKSPSTLNLISLHSSKLAIFNSMCSWKCHWGCKKKNALETIIYHDDL